MPLTPEWSNFFTAELGALAALTGFVVVAISINLARILEFAWLPSRAAEALIAPVGAITATGLILIPEQIPILLGTAILATGLVMVAAPVVIQLRSWSFRKEVTAVERIIRFAASAGLGVMFVVGAALVISGAQGGLAWLAVGDIATIVAVVLNAWILMIEILR
jgi:modulator of FtsH protease